MSVRRRSDSHRESRVCPEGGRFSVYAAREAELRQKLTNLARKLARDQPRPRDVTVRDCASACWYRLARQQWAIRGDGRSASWAHRRRRYAAWASRSLMDPHVEQRWVVLLPCSEALALESPGARERVTGWRSWEVAICRASHLPRPLAVASAAEPESGTVGRVVRGRVSSLLRLLIVSPRNVSAAVILPCLPSGGPMHPRGHSSLDDLARSHHEFTGRGQRRSATPGEGSGTANSSVLG